MGNIGSRIEEQGGTIFFIDRCLGGINMANFLRELSILVEVHDDHFRKDAQDIDWIREVTNRGWVILTRDESIGRNNLEKLAVFDAKARLFALVSKQATHRLLRDIMQKAYPNILDFLEKNNAPFMSKVYRDGKVKLWQDSNDLAEFKKRILDIESSSNK